MPEYATQKDIVDSWPKKVTLANLEKVQGLLGRLKNTKLRNCMKDVESKRNRIEWGKYNAAVNNNSSHDIESLFKNYFHTLILSLDLLEVQLILKLSAMKRCKQDKTKQWDGLCDILEALGKIREKLSWLPGNGFGHVGRHSVPKLIVTPPPIEPSNNNSAGAETDKPRHCHGLSTVRKRSFEGRAEVPKAAPKTSSQATPARAQEPDARPQRHGLKRHGLTSVRQRKTPGTSRDTPS